MGLLNTLSDTGDESQKKNEPASPPPLANQRLSARAVPQREAPAPPTASPVPEATPPARPGHEGTELTAPPRKWAAPAQVAPNPGSGGLRGDALTGEPEGARMRAETSAAGTPLSGYGAPSGRRLLVDFPAYRVSVFEEGTIAL